MKLTDGQVRALQSDLADALRDCGGVPPPPALREAFREACVWALCQESLRGTWVPSRERVARMQHWLATALAELDDHVRHSVEELPAGAGARIALRRAARRLAVLLVADAPPD